MNFHNVVLRLFGAVMVLLLIYGVFAPQLFNNQESDLGVIAGVTLCGVVAPIVVYLLIKPIIQFYNHFKN